MNSRANCACGVLALLDSSDPGVWCNETSVRFYRDPMNILIAVSLIAVMVAGALISVIGLITHVISAKRSRD